MPDPLRVLIHNSETEAFEAMLRAAYPQVQIRCCNSYEELSTDIGSFKPDAVYTVRFAGTPGFPREALFGADGPAWVANGGAGCDHFGTWDPARTTVTNAAGVAADMMAEYVMGGFLHFTLDVPGLQSDKGRCIWAARTVRPIKGKKLLIIGLGHTGRAIAKRAKAFGMKVIGTRASPRPMEDVDEVHASGDLGALLPHADFIAVATPLVPATRGLLGPAQFAEMKSGVIIADVSRGGVIDQNALLRALDAGHVAAGILDVFETEPLPPDSPMWTSQNTILSPHCSSVFDGWEQASFQMFLDNLGHWIRGEPLFNIVDPARGY